ncbi:MAG: 8-oxo-dGTP diphosphatase [Patescibacteria group bacterium]|jgi:8-oxo-dGTP pyrophosphatase MutT (NUDIX family)
MGVLLQSYKQKIKNLPRKATVVFLVTEDKILLGFKKIGFGKGNWTGIGGKAEEGETIEDAAKRELYEETEVTTSELVDCGVVNFYFPHIEDEIWNQEVHVYLIKKWNGEPKETKEIKPQWFEKHKIPYTTMWDDAHYWLPMVLGEKKVFGEFVCDESGKVVDYTIT